MNLLEAYSEVAGTYFYNYEGASEFYFGETFLNNYYSNDVKFAQIYSYLTGFEAKYQFAPKAFDVVKGMPFTFNGSNMGLASRLYALQTLWLPPKFTETDGVEVTPKTLKGALLDDINATLAKLSRVTSYVNNVVLNRDAQDQINDYFANNRKILLSLEFKTKSAGIVPFEVTLNKEEFKVVVLQLLGSSNDIHEETKFSLEHCKLLRGYLNKYISGYDIQNNVVERIPTSELKDLNKEFRKTGVNNTLLTDADMKYSLLFQLGSALNERDIERIKITTNVFVSYRNLILDTFLFCKSEQGQRSDKIRVLKKSNELLSLSGRLSTLR